MISDDFDESADSFSANQTTRDQFSIQIPSVEAICEEVEQALNAEGFTYENCTAITWEGQGQSTCNCLQATACSGKRLLIQPLSYVVF